MSDPDRDDGAWHLDKKVPLALIFTIMAQTSMGFWWASNTSTRLEAVERRVEQAAPQVERIIRVETKLEAIREAITEIKNLIRAKPELR